MIIHFLFTPNHLTELILEKMCHSKMVRKQDEAIYLVFIQNAIR